MGGPDREFTDTTALIGAFGDEDPNGDSAGAAYVFKATDGSWSQQAKFTADAVDTEDWFGRSVALSDDGTTALVGAENKMDINSMGTGKAYVFEASGGSWSQQTTLSFDGDESVRFGASVAVSGDGTTALIGDPQEIIPNNSMGTGSAYVFTL
ncbi:FG-GAP repeat protein [Haladaptatus halobius]|uniref:FG-GAP repeat protein n=1 Tax=Haladaptatus halobius TaxID=2884875 RepID=UPI001D0AC2FA|nr:FG-GAP repeat protein [Haladaptatus halobius]